jgi:predicted ATP-grasp superfamily ATP-dependent carboligase
MNAAVLVTDGEARAALAITRSLGRAGYTVFVCSSRKHSIAAASRHCAGHSRVTSALVDGAAFVREIRELCTRWRIGTLIPVTEESLLSVLRARDEFAGVVVPFPAYESFAAVSDKQKSLAIAAKIGMAVPEQWAITERTDTNPRAADVRFPVVIKPARSVSEADGKRIKLSASHAAGESELRARLRALPEEAFPVLIQRRIVGPGVGIFLLIWEGEIRAWFAHRRLREKPPAGGVSVYCESIEAPPSLVRAAADLLQQFGWRGVAMVEMKIDAGTGTPYLMEVNGRFWGSLQLAIDAGVDFPRLLIETAHGSPPSSPPAYRVGVRSRWWWGDVDHLIARLRRSRAVLSLPAEAGGRLRAIGDFARQRLSDRSDVFRWSDPLPFLRETLDWLARR